MVPTKPDWFGFISTVMVQAPGVWVKRTGVIQLLSPKLQFGFDMKRRPAECFDKDSSPDPVSGLQQKIHQLPERSGVSTAV